MVWGCHWGRRNARRGVCFVSLLAQGVWRHEMWLREVKQTEVRGAKRRRGSCGRG